jgi:hypothetical protein
MRHGQHGARAGRERDRPCGGKVGEPDVQIHRHPARLASSARATREPLGRPSCSLM